MASIFNKSDLQGLQFSIEIPIYEHVAIRRANARDLTKELCKFFQKGTCMKGDQCPYRHSRGEKSVVCKHWLRGLCKKNDACEFLHEYDLSKMPPCHFFINFGKCSNPECPFLHVNPEDQQKDCPWYKRGFCKNGPNCRYRHIHGEMCPRYLAGFCIDGLLCKLAHPKYDLPDEDETLDRTARPMLCLRCGSAGHFAARCPTLGNRSPTSGNIVSVIPPPTILNPDSEHPTIIQQIAPIGGKKNLKGGNSAADKALRALDHVQCFKCGIIGHYANVCPNPRRAPPPGGYQIPGISQPLQDPRFKTKQPPRPKPRPIAVIDED